MFKLLVSISILAAVCWGQKSSEMMSASEPLKILSPAPTEFAANEESKMSNVGSERIDVAPPTTAFIRRPIMYLNAKPLPNNFVNIQGPTVQYLRPESHLAHVQFIQPGRIEYVRPALTGSKSIQYIERF